MYEMLKNIRSKYSVTEGPYLHYSLWTYVITSGSLDRVNIHAYMYRCLHLYNAIRFDISYVGSGEYFIAPSPICGGSH